LSSSVGSAWKLELKALSSAFWTRASMGEPTCHRPLIG
jgi:hypothetical protein